MDSNISDNLAEYARLRNLCSSKVAALNGAVQGERLWILGTGPSLMKEDLSRFESQNVLYLNNSVALHDKIKPKNAFCIITDHIRLAELRSNVSIESITTFCSTDKVFNQNVSSSLFGNPLLFLMPKLYRAATQDKFSISIDNHFGFSREISRGVFLGKTVLMPGLQVAGHLKASEIILAGIDMTNSKGEYFSPDIRSHWSKFDYENDAEAHLKECVRELNSLGVSVKREHPVGSVNFLPSLSTL